MQNSAERKRMSLDGVDILTGNQAIDETISHWMIVMMLEELVRVTARSALLICCWLLAVVKIPVVL